MQKGFSLVELLVVVSIIAIMSVGAVVGFGRFGQVVDNEQVIAFIKDEIKRQELRVLNGQFKEVNIYFMPNYLVVDEVYNQDLPKMRIYSSCASPNNAGIRLTGDGNLYGSADNDFRLDLTPVVADDSEPMDICFDFNSSINRERVYKFKSGSQAHGIRFIHFNLNRENLFNTSVMPNVQIGAAAPQANSGQIRLKIESPYLKKTYFNFNEVVTQPLTIFVTSASDASVVRPLNLIQ